MQLFKLILLLGLSTFVFSASAQSKKSKEDKHTAAFDAALGLPPVETSLDSEYFQAYIREVARTGNTPF